MRLAFVWLLGLLAFSAQGQGLQEVNKVIKLMGCRFELTAVASNDTIAWAAIQAGIEEISRIERLISSWDSSSQTSAINKNAGLQPVVVDQELYDLIYRSKKVSKLSGGAFDISFASMDKIWDFNGKEQSLPDSQVVQAAAAKINWENIQLDPKNSSVFLKEKGMKIGFGAIGKGYAANCAKKIMEAIDGVAGGVVNASGDLIVWGKNKQEAPWTVQIAHPKRKDQLIGWLALKDMAIVTSGDYEKYFMSNGIRYAHIINPKTGYPTSGITSVTVVCPDAELADALATAIFVMGQEKGLKMVNQLKQVECLIITDKGELFTSDQLQLHYY